MRTLYTIGVGIRFNFLDMLASPVMIVLSLLGPLVYASMAFLLIDGRRDPTLLTQAMIGAGTMGIWSRVLFAGGGAIQDQRWRGTLELMIMAPRNAALTLLPVTLTAALLGASSTVGTLVIGLVVFHLHLSVASPWLLVLAFAALIVSLGMLGLLLAASFILAPNANALTNCLTYPVWLLSGMLVPITTLPTWARGVAYALPTTWGSKAINDAVIGRSVWFDMLWCLALGLAAFSVAFAAIRAVERRARTTATLSLV